MDALGVDVQVLHNTLWITNIAEMPDTEAALCRCWNRWMADVYRQGEGRLRWSCVIPTMTISESIEQMRYARNNGAVAVCLRAHEGGRHLIDPYFYPSSRRPRTSTSPSSFMYRMPTLGSLSASSPLRFRLQLLPLRVPTVTSCHEYIMSEVPLLFPTLRWGFIEVSAQWVPWLVKKPGDARAS